MFLTPCRCGANGTRVKQQSVGSRDQTKGTGYFFSCNQFRWIATGCLRTEVVGNCFWIPHHLLGHRPCKIRSSNFPPLWESPTLEHTVPSEKNNSIWENETRTGKWKTRGRELDERSEGSVKLPETPRNCIIALHGRGKSVHQ